MSIGIYQIKNTVNGKVYIGQSRAIERRWAHHKYALKAGTHENAHLQKSVNKYGFSAFEFSVLENCEVDELNEKEAFWIKETDAFNNGYNRTSGGDSPLEVSQETIKKRVDKLRVIFSTPERKLEAAERMKKAWQSDGYREARAKSLAAAMQKQSYKDAISKSTIERWKDPAYRQNYMDKMALHFADPEWKKKNDEIHREAAKKPERRAKIGAAHKKRFEENAALRDRYAKMAADRWADPEYHSRLSKKLQEAGDKRGISVLQVETGAVFCSAHNASKNTGILCSVINNCCLGKNVTAGDFHWRYANETEEDWKRRREDYVSSFTPMRRSGHKKIPVICVETNTRFDSGKDAAEFAGVTATSIARCLRGKQKTAGGYHWKYAD